MSKILVLTGSVRKGGNTDLLAEAFAEGTKKNNEVDIISVADVKVNPCNGCNACFSTEGNVCVQKDDMDLIYRKLKEADTLIIASPVYFYGISARLKAVIDRLHTPMRDQFGVKRMGLILVGAADIPELFDSIIIQYRLVLNFFHLEDIGMVLVHGAKDKGDVKKTTGLKEAERLGQTLMNPWGGVSGLLF
ncbi:MAG: flavodoxin family protein [Lachnospiraceae bacterium]|nr:flavodoxin family protein [Lachnospiraceae bacterium]